MLFSCKSLSSSSFPTVSTFVISLSHFHVHEDELLSDNNAREPVLGCVDEILKLVWTEMCAALINDILANFSMILFPLGKLYVGKVFWKSWETHPSISLNSTPAATQNLIFIITTIINPFSLTLMIDLMKNNTMTF